MFMIFKTAAFICLLLLLGVAMVDGCTCDLRPPACSEYWNTDAIFVGKVSKAYRPDDAIQERVEIEVEEAFKGIDSPFATTFNYGHSCAFTFTKESTYLFYGSHYKDTPSKFGTNFCTRTSRQGTPRFADDLEFLRSVKAEKSLFWIWGTVAEIGGDVPLAGIKATVLGQKSKIEGISDEFGDLRLEVSGPGKYRVRVHLPRGTTDVNYVISDHKRWEFHRKQVLGGKLTGRNRYLDYEVTVAANRCGWFDISIPGPEQH